MQKDLALAGLRAILGSIFVVHACDKLGIHSLSALWEVDNLTNHSILSLSPFSELVHSIFSFTTPLQAFWLAAIAACGELIAGWLLILGVFNRLAGFFLSIMMAVAVYFHFPYGFYGDEGGYEWAMLCLAGSQAIMFMGAGRFSLYELYLAISTERSQAA